VPEYDRLANIYDAWSAADPAAEPSRRYYVNLCSTERVPVVELGIGTGRIAIDIARLGIPVIGVDVSAGMGALCRRKFEEAGLQDRLQLLFSDVRDFELPEPTSLIIFPFRSIGHLLTHESKLALLQCVHRNLKPGGKFIFDHYILDEDWARGRHGIPQLMCRIPNQDGSSMLVWDVYHFDFSRQLMDCYITVDELDEAATLVRRTYRPLSFSWIRPEQVRDLLHQANFKVQAVYGDFDGGPLTDTSEQQIWVAERPTGS